MSKYIYLNDSDFLQEIDELPIKEQFVKITILDWNENPIQDIQGKVIYLCLQKNLLQIIKILIN